MREEGRERGSEKGVDMKRRAHFLCHTYLQMSFKLLLVHVVQVAHAHRAALG